MERIVDTDQVPTEEGRATHGPATRFSSLDGLRGIAAVVVMIHHSMMVLPSLAAPHFTNIHVEPALSWSWFAAHTPLHWFWAGREAVWVFFVLSGFVLTRWLMRTSRQSWLAYYSSRLIRLYVVNGG